MDDNTPIEVMQAKMCPLDGDPCANPDCSPGYCFPNSPARYPRHRAQSTPRLADDGLVECMADAVAKGEESVARGVSVRFTEGGERFKALAWNHRHAILSALRASEPVGEREAVVHQIGRAQVASELAAFVQANAPQAVGEDKEPRQTYYNEAAQLIAMALQTAASHEFGKLPPEVQFSDLSAYLKPEPGQ